ncbi:hypothetical protein GGR51DRAFT_159821 [Nemania sp. FL0031]|nr:hypothetical protein GGR51DRAFT_159821 [Nemania sp. FL0031]
MTEAGISIGTKVFTRWYDKGKNYKGDIQGGKARLVELRDTINVNRDHLEQFPWEYSDGSAADLEEYLRKGERVLKRETAKLNEDRGRGRTRYAIRPGARERRSRSTSRVSEAIARLGRKEASHRRRAESRERSARGSPRRVAPSNPDYYERPGRNYGDPYHQRAKSRGASVPGRTPQVYSDRLVAWLNEEHDTPAAESGRSSRGQEHAYERAIQRVPSSRAAPSNRLVSNWTHGTHSETMRRGNAQSEDWNPRRDSYYEYPTQKTWTSKRHIPQSEPVAARSTVTVYTRDRRRGRVIETCEEFIRTSRADASERLDHTWPEPTRTIIFN